MRILITRLVAYGSLLAFVLGLRRPTAAPPGLPNIVYILADDLGYGDVKCLNPEGKIATPNLDRLAGGGMRFTDAHSSSAVCSPSRYSILTGRYNWRSRLKNGVLTGYSPRLIELDRLTVPALLKEHGYSTACLGKWHLGMDWTLKDGGFAPGEADAEKVDYAQPIQNGPTTVGFDYYFGIAASLDMPPYIFLENNRCLGVPTVEKTWIRKGPAEKDFDAIDVLPALTRKAVEYIRQRAADAKHGKPFFLYLPLNAPHTPIVPTAEWQGKSGLNKYADFVMQTDWTVGAVLEALETNGLTEPTLVFFASDNGCSPSADFPQLAAKGHHPSYHFRGMKADIFDGGHRIPFLARWPGKVAPGSARTNSSAGGLDGHVRRYPGHEAAGQRGRGQRQPPARAAGPGQAAVAGGRGASFYQRLLRHPPGQLEARTLPGFGRLERPQTGERRGKETAAHSTLQPGERHRREAERGQEVSGGGRAPDEAAGELCCGRPKHARCGAEKHHGGEYLEIGPAPERCARTDHHS